MRKAADAIGKANYGYYAADFSGASCEPADAEHDESIKRPTIVDARRHELSGMPARASSSARTKNVQQPSSQDELI